MQTSSFWKKKYEELKKIEKDKANLSENQEVKQDEIKEAQKKLDEQITINQNLAIENHSLQTQLTLKTNLLTETNTLIKLIEDSLTNGIGDGSINVTNGNALVGNTIKSLKLINDYVSNNSMHIVLGEISSTETRIVTKININQLEQWQKSLTKTNEKIQQLLERQEENNLAEQLKNLQIQNSEDQSEENKEKLALVTKSLGELKEMLSTLRGGVNVTNGSALIDNIIENLETINNYTTNNYNNYEEILKELKKKQKELEKLEISKTRLLSFEEIDNIQTNLTVKKFELTEAISQVKNKLEKIEQEPQNQGQENYFIFFQLLLDSQETLTIYQNSPNITPLQMVCAEKQLQGAKRKLLKVLKEKEVDEICQLHEKAVKLQLELEKNQQIESKIEIITN